MIIMAPPDQTTSDNTHKANCSPHKSSPAAAGIRPTHQYATSPPSPSLSTDSSYVPQSVEPQRSASPSTSTHSSSHPPNGPKLRSNHISIVSLEDDNNDGNCSSSLADSDSDLDDMAVDLSQLVAKAATSGESAIHSNGMIVINNGTPAEVVKSGGSSVLPAGNSRPHIGSIALQNSSDITFGDKTFYQGPVTVKQFFLDQDQWRRQEQNTSVAGSSNRGTMPTPTHDEGRDNRAFEPGSAEDIEKLQQDRQGPQRSTTDSTNTNGTDKTDNRNFWDKLLRLERRPLELTILASVILLFVGIIAFVIHYMVNQGQPIVDETPGDGEDFRLNDPLNSTIAHDRDPTEYGTSIRYVTRNQWVAQPPRSELKDLELPATRVIITHTATEQCRTQAECVSIVRNIQMFHIESNSWDDIGYNYLVGGDGAIYIGRGWNKEGAHTRGFNPHSIGLAYIGTFMDVVPTERQLRAGAMLLEDGVAQKKLIPDYKLYGHRQLIATESPGAAFYRIIQTWPHWVNKSDA